MVNRSKLEPAARQVGTNVWHTFVPWKMASDPHQHFFAFSLRPGEPSSDWCTEEWSQCIKKKLYQKSTQDWDQLDQRKINWFKFSEKGKNVFGESTPIIISNFSLKCLVSISIGRQAAWACVNVHRQLTRLRDKSTIEALTARVSNVWFCVHRCTTAAKTARGRSSTGLACKFYLHAHLIKFRISKQIQSKTIEGRKEDCNSVMKLFHVR